MVDDAETEQKFGVLNRERQMQSCDSKVSVTDVLDSIWCLRRKLLDRQRALEGSRARLDQHAYASFPIITFRKVVE